MRNSAGHDVFALRVWTVDRRADVEAQSASTQAFASDRVALAANSTCGDAGERDSCTEFSMTETTRETKWTLRC
jgi:hypothetical protein